MINSLQARLDTVLPAGGFLRSVSVLAGGTALGQVVPILASPVLTRLYSAEDFGVLAVYASLLGMVVVVASLRYEQAIPLAKDESLAENTLALALGLTLGVSLLTGFTVMALKDGLAQWTNAPALEKYLWLLPIGVLVVGLYQALSYWAIRTRAFRRIARTRVSQGITGTATQLSLGLVNSGTLGLIAGQITGQAAGAGSLAALAWRDSQGFRRITFSGVRHAALRYRRFLFFSGPSALLNSAGLLAPAIFLATLYGPEVAGFYALSDRVIKSPLNLISRSVSQVYLSEAGRLANTDRAQLAHMFRKTSKNLLLVALAPILVLLVFGPSLFAAVFGSVWRPAGIYTQILGLMYLGQFVVTPLSQTLNVLERQDIQAFWDAFRMVLVIGSFLSAWYLALPATAALVIYSVTMALCYALLYVLSLQQLRERGG